MISTVRKKNHIFGLNLSNCLCVLPEVSTFMFLMSDSYQFLHNMRKNVDLFLSSLKNFLRRVLIQLLS